MAKIEKLGPIISAWEGGFVDDPKDRGGATKYGVTISTWKAQGYDKDGDGDIDEDDIRLLTPVDFAVILKTRWKMWKADQIINQSVANTLVDWLWGSGKWGIIIPQRVLGVVADGVVGPKTLAALNAANQEDFFIKIKAEREKFLNNIVKRNPSQARFIKGWLRRLNSFKFNEV